MHSDAITAVILAGGRGARMGGADKGLQTFSGKPLVLHTLLRLKPQVSHLMISANRNLPAYESFGVPVVADTTRMGEFVGPLAGFLTGLEHCKTPYLLTVPCDTPLFPQDLVARLAHALDESGADFAVASTPQENGDGSLHPVFCLMGTHLLANLRNFVDNGGRKITAWMAQQHGVQVPFNLPGDAVQAFYNVNSLAELEWLQAQCG